MKSEFIERTNYNPNCDEYRMIEESYYEFIGNKDEFCKQWLIDKNSGQWDKELKFRLQIEELKEINKSLSEELSETVERLTIKMSKNIELKARNDELIKKLERIERVMRNVFDK